VNTGKVPEAAIPPLKQATTGEGTFYGYQQVKPIHQQPVSLLRVVHLMLMAVVKRLGATSSAHNRIPLPLG
jgi:hypothetical protein